LVFSAVPSETFPAPTTRTQRPESKIVEISVNKTGAYAPPRTSM